MATPSYLGSGQPLADSGSGWLGRFGSLFGSGGNPGYAGNGQPSGGSGFLGVGTPAYVQAPVVTTPSTASRDPDPVVDESTSPDVVMTYPNQHRRTCVGTDRNRDSTTQLFDALSQAT